MMFEPGAYGGQQGYWCWPLRTMNWTAGLVYLVAVPAAWRFRQRPGVVLLGLCFLVTFAIVTIIPGSPDFWDPFWWASMATSPAVIMTGLCFAALVGWRRHSLWVLAALLGWLLVATTRTLTEVPFSWVTC